jgi:hypothetical protein
MPDQQSSSVLHQLHGDYAGAQEHEEEQHPRHIAGNRQVERCGEP